MQLFLTKVFFFLVAVDNEIYIFFGCNNFLNMSLPVKPFYQYFYGLSDYNARKYNFCVLGNFFDLLTSFSLDLVGLFH